jgi:hypothetical protein
MTAGALTVLSAYRDRYPEACRAAGDFLIAAQQPDGRDLRAQLEPE